jgi:hypothetical protein
MGMVMVLLETVKEDGSGLCGCLWKMSVLLLCGRTR